MAYPKPVPTLNKDQSKEFSKRLKNFEVSQEMKDDIEKMRQLKQSDD